MHDPQDGPPRAATIRDVAARAGVSPATVSRVLTGSRPVSSAAQARIQRAIKDLDYVVNAQARALSAPHSRTVAILLPALSWQFHNRVASGIEQQAINEDRLCVVCSTRSNPDREIALLETLRQHNTEAVVLIGGTVVTPTTPSASPASPGSSTPAAPGWCSAVAPPRSPTCRSRS